MSAQETDAETTVLAEFLRNFLSGRDAACPNRSYNLRDLQGFICPECGEKIVLWINLAEPKQGLLIAGLVGLSAGMGLNGLLLIYLAIEVWGEPLRIFKNFLLVNSIGFVVETTAMSLWLANWRRLRHQPLSRRVVWMIACWGLTLADLFAFSWMVK
jgi:hypothetical protein